MAVPQFHSAVQAIQHFAHCSIIKKGRYTVYNYTKNHHVTHISATNYVECGSLNPIYLACMAKLDFSMMILAWCRYPKKEHSFYLLSFLGKQHHAKVIMLKSRSLAY